MKRYRSGSLLIVALMAVSVVTLLALALGTWMTAQARALEADRYRREVRGGAATAAQLCLAERVVADTNDWDALQETWAREPWERRDAGWILRVSGRGWSDEPGATEGLIDENGKIPLNLAPVGLLTVLFMEVAEMPRETAEDYARRITDWRDEDLVTGSEGMLERVVYGTRDRPWDAPNRPYVCVEALAAVPGLAAGPLAAVTPFLTVEGPGRINLNTASGPVLRAAFQAAGDPAAGSALLGRILAFRHAGQVFHSPMARDIGRSLGGLPPDEAALLGRIEGFVSVRSSAVSGVAEATPAAAWTAGRRGGRAWFTWHRGQVRFSRWIEE